MGKISSWRYYRALNNYCALNDLTTTTVPRMILSLSCQWLPLRLCLHSSPAPTTVAHKRLSRHYQRRRRSCSDSGCVRVRSCFLSVLEMPQRLLGVGRPALQAPPFIISGSRPFCWPLQIGLLCRWTLCKPQLLPALTRCRCRSTRCMHKLFPASSQDGP